MTDIQYHLKIIQQLVAARLNDHDISDINEELTLLLPDSYGVASGRVRNENGQWSRHLPLVIYDKTMAGREYPRHNPTVDINEVLAVASYAPSHTRKLLVSDLRDIASVKTLKSGSRQSQKQLAAPTNRIPKHRIPVAMIITRYLDGFNPDREADYIWLHEIISKRALQVAPDFIHLTAQNVLYRNPLLLEHLPLTGYDMGLSRTPRLAKPRTCYVCKHRFYRTHFFYEKLCVHCGDISYKKRIDRVDLSERTAVVTGGRVKIGYETVLRLLRAGAQVIVTTRFPHDAALRYASETDFETWRNRLRIYQLDMRNPVTVQQFVADLYDTLPHLDILVNNAAQTVRRPQAYYAHLLEGEAHALPEPLQPLVLNSNSGQDNPLAPVLHVPSGEQNGTFPAGQLDADGQQIDNRPHNSWVMRADEVTMPEMLEVQLVNVVAPQTLVSQLKPLLMAGSRRSYIINVSAAEGQFSAEQRGLHPHTSMAKAALNMLTRTVGPDYIQDGIAMVSVDPGWVSDQMPHTTDEERAQMARLIPLDSVDGAARVCDPIFMGTRGRAVVGLLLKDFREVPW